jgi:cytoskeletal protein CcmA (bactofilin family)
MSAGSVIGPDTVVHGNVRGQGSLEILGRVDGDVQLTGDVSVGEGGAVRGNISAATISVSGAVQGDLRASAAVLVERGGRVLGDLAAPRIGIASGALVRGSVRTEGEPSLGAARTAPAAPALRPPVVPVATAALPTRPTAFVAKPVAKAEPKLAPPARLAVAAVKSEPKAAPPPLAPVKEERRPPPPVLPSLGKGAKAKKKKGRDE